jgi:hypothetical protein
MSLLADPLVILLVVITAAVLYFYWSGSAQRQRYKPVPIAKEGSNESLSARVKKSLSEESVDCPKCGRRMDAGYVLGPGGLFWSGEAPMFNVMGATRLPFGFGAPLGAEPLTSPLLRGMGRLPNLKAYRCHNCNILHVDLTQEAEF